MSNQPPSIVRNCLRPLDALWPSPKQQRVLTLTLTPTTTLFAVVAQAYVLLVAPQSPLRRLYSPNNNMLIAYAALEAVIGAAWVREVMIAKKAEPEVMSGDEDERAVLVCEGLDEKPAEESSVLRYDADADDEGENASLSSLCRRKLARRREANPYGLEDTQAAYLPFFVASNLCFIAWSVAWLTEHYIVSQICLVANLLIQIYAVFVLLHTARNEDYILSRTNWLTHLLVKTGAGVAVLYLWKNWGVIDKLTSPTAAEKLNSGVIFLLMTIGSGPDPTLGICLLYDLFALVYGHQEGQDWQKTFKYIAGCISAVVAWDIGIIINRRKASKSMQNENGHGERSSEELGPSGVSQD